MNELKKITSSNNRILLLNESHIHTLTDLILHLPYRYEEIEEEWIEGDGPICVEGIVCGSAKNAYYGRMSRLIVPISIRGKVYQVTIFNRHFLIQYLLMDRRVTIIGKKEGNRITASQIVTKTLDQQRGLHPVYSLKEGLTNKVFSNYVKKAFDLISEIDDFIPEDYKQKYHFQSKLKALKEIHFPSSKESLVKAMKMFKYEEFLKFQLTMQYIKIQREQEIGLSKRFSINDINDYLSSLPFHLTDDQQQAVKDILKDLAKPIIMYRFLQGDVGSGKTVVSSIALYANYLAGYQGALMAPTEVLAVQHYKTLSHYFRNTDIKLALLTGTLSLKEKENIYKCLENHEVDVIIGTHALFQEKVNYHKLGLVITDEQHRFGVEQRKALKDKGKNSDFMVMSATPIPRTLALTLFGDMDVSTIKTKPTGRLETRTVYYFGKSVKPFLKELKDYLASLGQVYVICPMIEENEDQSLKSAEQVYQAMSKYFKGHYQIGLLHGHLKDEEKNKVMDDFSSNRIQILVSTTVIEVGIDVKNANMMIIYDADRFGLSQIHQLRGRVGRGTIQGRCFLLSTSKKEETIERLRFLESHSDGFEISEYDLSLRGPGEVLGDKQSGMPSFVLGDLVKDYKILETARNDAIKIIEDYYKYDEYKQYIEKTIENIKSGNEYID